MKIRRLKATKLFTVKNNNDTVTICRMRINQKGL